MQPRKPTWLKAPLPTGERYQAVRRVVSGQQLHTVCEEARCPNIGECWNCGTATFLILGDTCTRGCAFCAVTRGNPKGALPPDEPARLAEAATAMGLDYVVITSVTRDDLPDGGAGIFAGCIAALAELPTKPLVEVLTPDYQDDDLRCVLDARPAVFAHNVEVVERLAPTLRHPAFTYAGSLHTLQQAARHPGGHAVKSSIMLGAGETLDEVRQTMRDLRNNGVQILVLGQYLQPTQQHAPVRSFIPPETFDALAATGKEMGFEYVAAGPLVRTSYRAAEAYVQRRFARHPA
ncbi:MAG: lipoyl synthase [Proteobacteria bacterium]|nr:lipoyl synthase [Pseudomonadota bacterium]